LQIRKITLRKQGVSVHISTTHKAPLYYREPEKYKGLFHNIY